MSEQVEKWWEAQYSYEAVSMDTMSPLWFTFQVKDGNDTWAEKFGTEEAAEAFAARKHAEMTESTGSPLAIRTVLKKAPRPEEGYVDEFLEAEFAANRSYWADRARAEREREEATPAKGKDVTYTNPRAKATYQSGGKVPVGQKGYVAWTGDSNYGLRVGVKTPEGEFFFTSASNVTVEQKELVSA